MGAYGPVFLLTSRYGAIQLENTHSVIKDDFKSGFGVFFWCENVPYQLDLHFHTYSKAMKHFFPLENSDSQK